jgi:hypothetical protein
VTVHDAAAERAPLKSHCPERSANSRAGTSSAQALDLFGPSSRSRAGDRACSSVTARQILSLQRLAGNRATSELIAARASKPLTATRPVPVRHSIVVQRLVTKEHQDQAKEILKKVDDSGRPILVVPDGFNMSPENPGLTLQPATLETMRSGLLGVTKEYTDPGDAVRRIKALVAKSILVKELIFKQDSLYQHGVVFHEWGHVVGAPTEDAGVFANELELISKFFGVEEARRFLLMRSVSYYGNALVGRGNSLERLLTILTKLAEGAPPTMAEEIQSVVKGLGAKEGRTKAGRDKLKGESTVDLPLVGDPSSMTPPPKGNIQVLNQLPMTEPKTGQKVFSQPPNFIHVLMDDGQVVRVRAGQNYLNTQLSIKYMADGSAIKGSDAKIKKGMSGHAPDIRTIADGHHRFIWSAFHGKPIPVNISILPLAGIDWKEMTYKEA